MSTAIATLQELSYEIERNKPMPNLIHGAIQYRLGKALTQYDRQFLFADEVSLFTTPSSTPDICIFAKRKLTIEDAKAKVEEAPITTIEIQSPSQSAEELIAKIYNTYFPMGVQSAWIVFPALKAIQVLLPNQEKSLFISGQQLKDPVTNIEISIDAVFEDLE